MSEADDDTLLGDTGDTIAAPSQPSNPSVSGVRIRASRPSVSPVATDYPELTVVDPAHYVIGREIARGGMGRIQIAHDRRLGRDVAVKEVLVAAGSIARRFEREARITARLQHPSIISVHEAGKWPSGEPFYAMRLVTGRSLDEAIDGKPYARRLAILPSVLAVADAMAYAHGQKVIHRDLKPKNVIVGDFGETVVIDWGLAKELGAADDPMTSLTGMPTPSPFTESQPGETTLGEVLGTPQYMPPEQATGEPVDERADVYAIGSILYHVLAGRPPYVAESNAELIAALHAAPPLPISRFAPEVSGELVAIAERAMARERDGRYPTAKELADDLRRFQTGQMVGAHRYSLRQLLGRWVNRNRTGLAAAAAALLVAVTVGVVAVRRIVAAEQVAQGERATAVLAQTRANELADFMLGDLREKLTDAGRLDLLESVAKRAIASYDAAATNATEQERALAAYAHAVLGTAAQIRGDTGGAISTLEVSRKLLKDLLAEHPDNAKYLGRLLDLERVLASDMQEVGKRREAEKLRDEVALAALAGYAAHPEDFGLQTAAVNAHVQIATHKRKDRDKDGSLAELKIALDIATKMTTSENTRDPRVSLVKVHGVIADVYDEAHEWKKAAAEYETGFGLALAAIATAPKNVVWLSKVVSYAKDWGIEIANDGDVAGGRAKILVALDYSKRALAIDPTNQNLLDQQTGLQEQLGIFSYVLKDYDAALEHYIAFSSLEEELSARDPKSVTYKRGRSLALNKLGDVYEAKGDYRTAIARYTQALPIREEMLESDSSNPKLRRDLFFSHYRLAMMHKKAKDDAAYAGELRTALAIAETTHKLEPVNETYAQDLVQTIVHLAEIDKAGAKAYLARAEEVARDMAAKPNADKEWAKTIDDIVAERAKHK